MRAEIRCRSCDYSWVVHNEPQSLATLACPQCQSAAASVAAEDFASALEDMLVQLHALSRTHQLELSLSTHVIPADFIPLPEDVDPN